MEPKSKDHMSVLSALPPLDGQGRVQQPIVVVDLDVSEAVAEAVKASAGSCAGVGPAGTGRLFVGVATRPLSPQANMLAEVLDVTYVREAEGASRAMVEVPDPRGALDRLAEQATRTPVAALTLTQLLRATEDLVGQSALMVESFAYSMLLTGSEYKAWLGSQARRRPSVPTDGPLVQVDRAGGRLEVMLNHDRRRNAYSARLRDELHDALRVALLDPLIESVVLCGAGPSFSAGGDLDEFGTIDDPALAHIIRSTAGVATSLETLRPRLEVRVQGPSVGAGVEMAAFGGRVVARPDATFRLPEVLMGLLPGAGGTVSIARRIGRWRLLHLCLSGEQIDAGRALDWGLVDEVEG